MALAYVSTLRLFNRDVRRFLGSAAVNGFAQDGIRAVLLNLYLLRLGYTTGFVGLTSAANALAFTLGSLPAGALGSRWGTRRVMIAGMGLIACGSLLTPAAESVPVQWQAGWFLGANTLGGLGLSFFLVSSIPFLMASTRLAERHHAFSMQMGLVPLATFAGSLVGGVLPGILASILGTSQDDPAPYRLALLLGACVLLPALVALLSLSRDAPRPVVDDSAPPRSPGIQARRLPLGLLMMIGLLAGLRFAGQSTARTFFNVYLDDGLGVSTALIGALAAAGQLLAVPAALATPLLLARWSKGRAIFLGSLGQALSQCVLALVPHWGAAGLGLAGTTALFSVTTTAYRLFSQELVPIRWRSAMSSALMMGGGLSLTLMSAFGGLAISALGYTTLFLIAAAVTVAGALIFYVYFRTARGLADEGDPFEATAAGE